MELVSNVFRILIIKNNHGGICFNFTRVGDIPSSYCTFNPIFKRWLRRFAHLREGWDVRGCHGPLGEALDIVDELHLLMTFYNCTRLSLSELPITETELKLMAAAAIMGDNSIPKNGYRMPAAIGTPAVL